MRLFVSCCLLVYTICWWHIPPGPVRWQHPPVVFTDVDRRWVTEWIEIESKFTWWWNYANSTQVPTKLNRTSLSTSCQYFWPTLYFDDTSQWMLFHGRTLHTYKHSTFFYANLLANNEVWAAIKWLHFPEFPRTWRWFLSSSSSSLLGIHFPCSRASSSENATIDAT